MFEAKEILPQNTDWIVLVFFVIFSLLTVLKISFEDRLYQTITLFFSKKNLSIYFNKEKINVFNLFQSLFFLVQLLIISLLFYVLIGYFKTFFQPLNFKTYTLILLGVILYFGFRFVLGFSLAYVLNLTNVYKKILFEKINYFNALILWIIPPLLFLIYTDKNQNLFLWITIILLVILLILRYGLILNNNKYLIFKNLLYFILYLCALEIAPLLIILKLTF